jgi:hypothetical protein
MSALNVVPIITHTLWQALNVAVDHDDQVATVPTITGDIRLDGTQIDQLLRRIGVHPHPPSAG